MISFPHSKINIGLSIVSKRSDGFHNLETIFYPLSLRDALEIMPSDEIKFVQTGLKIPGRETDNLVIHAYNLLKKDYSQIKPLQIYLHKAIPVGAGLGGGSSDAARIIRLIDKLFDLHISADDMNQYASKLGSDCPFFMQDAPCFAEGRGEILKPVRLDLSEYSFLLVHPEIRIGTAWAYSMIQPAQPKYNLEESIQQPIHIWKNMIQNDFEIPVFKENPVLQEIKEKLYEYGALYAAMTGSGSTIFGIFNRASLPETFKVENASLTIIR